MKSQLSLSVFIYVVNILCFICISCKSKSHFTDKNQNIRCAIAKEIIMPLWKMYQQKVQRNSERMKEHFGFQ